MPRAKRIEYPGAHYHCMCRGNNGQEIFLSDDGRKLFLATLGEVCEQTGWVIHAYVLMSNHYHLLLETPETNLVDGMSWFQGSYTQRFNAMFKRRGHLYQGRYKAIPIATDPREGGLIYFRQVSSYIHLNPFRAKLCGQGCSSPLENYVWSSYPAYIGKARKQKWLKIRKVLHSYGLSMSSDTCSEDYHMILERKMRFENDPDAGRRGEFEKMIKRGWYLGDEAFEERLLSQLSPGSQGDNLRGDQRRAHGQAEAERLWRLGLDYFNLQEEELLSAKSTRMEKQALAWLLKTYTTAKVSWIADRYQYGHPSTASLAINRFKRDDREVAMKMKTELKNLVVEDEKTQEIVG